MTNEEVFAKAAAFYAESKAHVDRLRHGTYAAIEPDRHDRRDPRLWKSCHWNWYFEMKAA